VSGTAEYEHEADGEVSSCPRVSVLVFAIVFGRRGARNDRIRRGASRISCPEPTVSFPTRRVFEVWFVVRAIHVGPCRALAWPMVKAHPSAQAKLVAELPFVGLSLVNHADFHLLANENFAKDR
jgi:hypothetical protein